jgi:hypothetical protein
MFSHPFHAIQQNRSFSLILVRAPVIHLPDALPPSGLVLRPDLLRRLRLARSQRSCNGRRRRSLLMEWSGRASCPASKRSWQADFLWQRILGTARMRQLGLHQGDCTRDGGEAAEQHDHLTACRQQMVRIGVQRVMTRTRQHCQSPCEQ